VGKSEFRGGSRNRGCWETLIERATGWKREDDGELQKARPEEKKRGVRLEVGEEVGEEFDIFSRIGEKSQWGDPPPTREFPQRREKAQAPHVPKRSQITWEGQEDPPKKRTKSTCGKSK